MSLPEIVHIIIIISSTSSSSSSSSSSINSNIRGDSIGKSSRLLYNMVSQSPTFR